jgi:N,N'-diacetyllegionaminate synthase
MSCFIIAEAGVNHNGSLELALGLVDAAAAAGADAVKFQSFQAEKLVTPYADTAEYQKQATGKTSQFEMLKSLELPVEFHHRLVERCQARGIEFMSTAFDVETLDFLCTLGIQRLKIPSGEITHHALLAHAASKNLPIILSTGMATLEEVAEAVETIANTRKELGFCEPLDECLILLHCTSNYPAALSDVHLRAIETLSHRFNLPVGYSDHTPEVWVPLLAIAMGGSVIEKHFTLDRNLPGPDHLASLEPQALAQMVQLIRQAEVALGEAKKTPCKNEISIRNLVRRSVTLKYDRPAGALLAQEDLILLRPGDGIEPKYLPEVIGKRLKQTLAAGTTLQWEQICLPVLAGE